MVAFGLVSTLLGAAGLVAASVAPSPPTVAVRTRNIPGTSDDFTLHAIARRFAALAIPGKRNTVLKNSTSLSKSWTDATLFSQTFDRNLTRPKGGFEGGATLNIAVKCVTCYFKAAASIELAVNGKLDVGGLISNVTEQVADDLKNLTDTAGDALKAFGKSFLGHLGIDRFEDAREFDLNNFTFKRNFDIEIPPLPQVDLSLSLNDLDVYVELDTTIDAAATLTIPLFKSNTNFGVEVSQDLQVGFIATVDLILDVKGGLDLRTGFHLKVDRDLGFKLALFSQNVSSIIFHGGKFEFLPVTVVTAGAVLRAVVRVGMHVGVAATVSFPQFLNRLPKDIRPKDFGAGIEVGVFSNIADFVTNVSAAGAAKAAHGGSGDCALRIAEEYTLGLGAAAGATIHLGDNTWGPTPNTTVPIFYTTLATACAATRTPSSASASASPVPSLSRRQGGDALTTTTLTTPAVFTALGCAVTSLINCPVSLQTTSVLSTVRTLVTAVPSGVVPTFPATTADLVAATSAFGKAARDLAATTGLPVSFVPPPPLLLSSILSDIGAGGADIGNSIANGLGDAANGVANWLDGETRGVSNKVILGVAVGVGVPVLAAIIASLVHCCRRRRYSLVPKSEGPLEYRGAYQSPMMAPPVPPVAPPVPSERDAMLKKSPVMTVTVGETH